jgi:NADH:ubiquinone oxidoreductase subunit 3 (subunit A)
MPNDTHPYLFLAVFLVIAVGFPLIPIALAKLWANWYSPAKPSAEKNATFECGLEAKGDAWGLFSSQYYIYGVLFLIFDIEAIFLLPFAVAFTGFSFSAVLAMLVFIFFLAESLAWAWRKGLLVWK